MTEPAATSQLQRSDRRVPELDGIRAVAILLVIVWHYIHLKTTAEPGTAWARINILFRLSWSGVDLFFVLSGLLIGGILLSQRESPNYYSAFYGRRTLRILPLYFGFLGGCTIVQWLSMHSESTSINRFFEPALPLGSFATFTQNIAMVLVPNMGSPVLGGTWSLAVEEQFYLILPLLIRLVPVPRLPLVLLGLAVLGILMRIGLFFALPTRAGQAAYLLLPCRWDPLFLGVLLAWVFRHPVWVKRVASAGRYLRVLTSILALGLVLTAVSARGVIMADGMTLWGYTLIGVFYALVVLLVLAGHAPWLAAALRQPTLVYIGTISYGIYVFHSPVNEVLHWIVLGAQPRFDTLSQGMVTGLAFLTTILLADASWRWFEKPFVDWSHRRFRYRKAVTLQSASERAPTTPQGPMIQGSSGESHGRLSEGK